MTTQNDLDKMRRELNELRRAVLERRYGLGSNPVIIIQPGETAEQAIARRLSHVPADLRSQIKASTVAMPWLTSRNVSPERFEEAI